MARDEKNHITDLLYTLEGQREVKFLPTLPKDDAEAKAAYANWTAAQAKLHPVTKENASVAGDLWLKEEVASSACRDISGHESIVLRRTPWGRNSVTFKVNPSPFLFADQAIRTVGQDSL